MMNNLTYRQPYEIGTKAHKSLVVVIPAKLARENGVTKNTLFAVHADPKTKMVTLRTVRVIKDNSDKKEYKPAIVSSATLC